ncbi:hypothetical protein VMCG_05624 [Cytospora schulzeri]|uniref:Uncharacterized protein n=1 Tax=Cytospora schulzeri TaxID=448051 RepID=A0A423WFA5_9PEZI|nr:hypothetical protein VMCG_05624 [Valsa malicola]
MADPPHTVPTSPYHEFQGPHPHVPNWYPYELTEAFTDDNGVVFYESPERLLLLRIIKLDDVATLRRYQAANSDPKFLLYEGHYLEDQFGAAASYGSRDCLAVLLECWQSVGGFQQTVFTLPNARCGTLLHLACAGAQVETVMLLLSDPWRADFGDVRALDTYMHLGTPLLQAAGSWGSSINRKFHRAGRSDSLQERLARSEETIRILLERGASASDTKFLGDAIEYTVLSEAVRGASSALIERLIEEGADVNATVMDALGDCGGDSNKSGINLAHIASKHANLGALQVVMDKGDNLVRQVDSYGRICLHYAAIGDYQGGLYMVEREDIIQRVTDIIKFLFTSDSLKEGSAVNKQDCYKNTSLHYAMRRRDDLPNGDIGFAIARILCEHGADASIRGWNGWTPLHSLCVSLMESEPVETALIDLLLAHSAGVGEVDTFGCTALHYIARQLPQVGAAQHLLSRGADVRAVNSKGDTPLHEAARGEIHIKTLDSVAMDLSLKAADKARVQDAMLQALTQGLLPDEISSLLDQANKEGKTPRQLCEETLENWRQMDERFAPQESEEDRHADQELYRILAAQLQRKGQDTAADLYAGNNPPAVEGAGAGGEGERVTEDEDGGQAEQGATGAARRREYVDGGAPVAVEYKHTCYDSTVCCAAV